LSVISDQLVYNVQEQRWLRAEQVPL
jgi:hypothetical protein